jgi:tetratricopeptide (TPR) repeat protein
MWDLAVREEDFGGINDMLARYVGRAPLSMRLLPAAARSDTAAIRVLLEEGRALESRQLQIAARYAASYLQDFALADSLARLDLQWRERPANRASAQVLLGGLAVGEGRWSVARSAYRAAASMEGAGSVVVHSAVAATLPQLPVPPQDLRAIRDDVMRWDPRASASAGLTGALQPHLRHYLLGLLSSRLGEFAAAEEAAKAIESLETEPRGQVMADLLAATVRADVAWMQKRYDEVVRILDAVPQQIPLELIATSRAAHLREFGMEHARYIRALAFSERGQNTEALMWFRFGLRGSPQEYLYHAPVHVQMGALFERLGKPDSAAVPYRKFLGLWSRADSSAQPLLDDVRRRLGALPRPS